MESGSGMPILTEPEMQQFAEKASEEELVKAGCKVLGRNMHQSWKHILYISQRAEFSFRVAFTERVL